MILVLCVDDLTIGTSAYKSAFGESGYALRSNLTSGHVAMYWDMKSPIGKQTVHGVEIPPFMKVDEDLFVTAHGNKMMIGNEGSDDDTYNIEAAKLAVALSNNVLPSGYSGDIYLSACKSYYFGISFKRYLINARPKYKGKVHGYKGQPSSSIDVLDQKPYKEVP